MSYGHKMRLGLRTAWSPPTSRRTRFQLVPRTSWRLGVEKKLRFVKVYSANTAGEMVSPLSAPIRDAFALPTPTSLSFTDTNAATFSVAGLLELTGSTDPDVLRALNLQGFG